MSRSWGDTGDPGNGAEAPGPGARTATPKARQRTALGTGRAELASEATHCHSPTFACCPSSGRGREVASGRAVSGDDGDWGPRPAGGSPLARVRPRQRLGCDGPSFTGTRSEVSLQYS